MQQVGGERNLAPYLHTGNARREPSQSRGMGVTGETTSCVSARNGLFVDG